MNTKTLLLLGGLGVGLYFLTKKASSTPPSQQSFGQFETIPAGTTAGEYKITVDINNPRQGVDWINENIFSNTYTGAGQSTVVVRKGKTSITSAKGGKLVVNTTRYTPPSTGSGKKISPNKNAAAIARYRG